MKMFARGKSKKSKGMNKLEAAYALELEGQLRRGEIAWYRYEGLKLRLGEGAFFTPDFFVMKADGELQIHETKGFMREAAHVRLKVAAEMFPLRTFLIKKGPGGWQLTEY